MSKQCCQRGLLSDSSEFQKILYALKKIDFELAYLAMLTYEGIKPLSRWEKELENGGLEALREIGLLTKHIRRMTATGKEIVETVFSRTPAYIKLYEERFEGSPIDKSAATQRFEGFLFGYPPCCIRQYINHPYAPNGLSTQEQEILFHWACRDCHITSSLVRYYARVNALISRG